MSVVVDILLRLINGIVIALDARSIISSTLNYGSIIIFAAYLFFLLIAQILLCFYACAF